MKEISAGGVVFRRNHTKTEIMLIEDRYERATLPKGKQERGETIEETALREIKEETGMTGKIVAPLEVIHYRYEHPEKGTVDKEVHYFLVEAVSGSPTPQLEEINQVHWYSPLEALNAQEEHGYENNLSVLKKAFKQLNLYQG